LRREAKTVTEGFTDAFEYTYTRVRNFRTDTVAGQDRDQGVQDRASSKWLISSSCCCRKPS
jgi:hypothetical protein